MQVKYSKEFREEALKLSDELGSKKAVESLGVKYSTLADWRAKRNQQQKKGEKISEADKDEQIKTLKRENYELKRANDILKDAISFFAADRKK